MKYLNEISQEIQNEKIETSTPQIEAPKELIQEKTDKQNLEIKNKTPEDSKPTSNFTKRKILFYIILTILVTIAIKIIPGLI